MGQCTVPVNQACNSDPALTLRFWVPPWIQIISDLHVRQPISSEKEAEDWKCIT